MRQAPFPLLKTEIQRVWHEAYEKGKGEPNNMNYA